MHISSLVATIPVEQDESLLSTGLFQATRHSVLIGVEAQGHLSTEELMLRPGASDILRYDLDSPDRGWQAMRFPLQDKEEILVFKMDESSRLLGALTWFDEPERTDIRMQLHLVHFDTLSAIRPPHTFNLAWKRELFREESPSAFIDIHGDLIGIFVHELISKSHLRVFNWRKGTQVLDHTCSRAIEGSSFSFISHKTVAVANRSTGTIDLIPISTSSGKHIHRLGISPTVLPTQPNDLSVNTASHSSSDLVAFKFGVPFGSQIYLVIRREQLLRFSAEFPPSFPDLTTNMLVDECVPIPWTHWGKHVDVISNNTLQSDMLMLDGPWFITKTRAPEGNHFVVQDIVARRTILEATLEYQDVIVQSDSKRILGLRVLEHGPGDRSLEDIDVFILQSSASNI